MVADCRACRCGQHVPHQERVRGPFCIITTTNIPDERKSNDPVRHVAFPDENGPFSYMLVRSLSTVRKVRVDPHVQ